MGLLEFLWKGNVMRRKVYEILPDKTGNKNLECHFSGEEGLLSLLIAIMEILTEIREMTKPASGQLNDLHKSMMPKPKEMLIPVTIEELLAKHIQLDLLKKKRNK